MAYCVIIRIRQDLVGMSTHALPCTFMMQILFCSKHKETVSIGCMNSDTSIYLNLRYDAWRGSGPA